MKLAVIDQFEILKKGKNIGDYVQTLATLQYVKKEAIRVHRERLDQYEGECVKLIMNSWFLENPIHWPPSNKIFPLFISSHFTNESFQYIINHGGIDYFRKYEPIGCRDQQTCDMFNNVGIKAYFSGCLTLTLGKSFQPNCERSEILFVDVMYNFRTFKEVLRDMIYSFKTFVSLIMKGGINEIIRIINNLNKRKLFFKLLFSSDLLNKGIFISQLVKLDKKDDYLNITNEYIQRLANAKLVITSRIHCALPCLAVGTPVIFIDSDLDSARLSGLKDLFYLVTIKNSTIKTNFDLEGQITENTIIKNKNDFLWYKNILDKKCNDFIKNENINS